MSQVGIQNTLPSMLVALPALGWPGQMKGWPGQPAPLGVAQGPRRPATLAFFGCHQGLATGPAARHGVDGPHSCSAHVPSHQPPDRLAVGKGERGARREGGQRLQLSGQQVLRGWVTADSGCFPPWAQQGGGFPLTPRDPGVWRTVRAPPWCCGRVGISSL